MGNTWGKGSGKKSAKVMNETKGSDRQGSLIHSDKSDPDAVEQLSMSLHYFLQVKYFCYVYLW